MTVRAARSRARSARVSDRLIIGLALATILVDGAAAQTGAGRFEIDEFRVEGNTTLPPIEVERAVKRSLGPNRTAQDVEAARAALEQLYADRGFPTVSVQVPQQQVVDGLIRMKVVERTVGRLRVTGSRYFAQDTIRAGARSVAEGRVPNVNRLQREIVALNQRADRSVTPVLRAGAEPNTVDVDLQVTDTLPLHGSLEVNNRYSQSTKPLRLLASINYDNLWQRGDSVAITYQVAPQRTNDVNVISGSYLFRIPDSDMSLLASYLHSDSNVTTVGNTNVVGRGDIAGLRLLKPLGTDEDFTHSASFGADYKKVGEDVLVGADRSRAPLTYYPFTASYQATWYDKDLNPTSLVASLTTAFRGLGSTTEQFDRKRFDAKPNFAYVRGELSRVQALPFGLQLYARAAAQLAAEPLVSNEQFSLGGLDTVRGYLESEALGDYGGALQLELRSPNFSQRVDDRVKDLRAFAFGDMGGVAIHNPLPQQTSSHVLGSTGVGVRVRVFDYLHAETVAAVALADGPATRSGGWRLLFRTYGEF